MNKLIKILFLLSVFGLSFLPIKDTDFGWHYRYGNEFLKYGNLGTQNTFSYFLPNYHSANTHLFYDIAIAYIYNHFGFIGLSVFGALIYLLCAILFMKIINNQLWLKILAFYCLWFLSGNIFSLGIRSQIITYLFFLLLLFILEKANNNQKYLYFLPLILFIWVNSHIGFFVGLFVLVFYTIDQIIKIYFLKKEKINRQIIILISVLFFSFAISLLNPYGISVYKEVIRHAFSPLGKMIAEWVSPPLWNIALVLILALISLVSAFKNKSFSIYKFLLLLLFGILAISAKRNLPFFYTIFFYIILENLKSKLKNLEIILIPVIISTAFFILIIQVPTTLSYNTSWTEYCDKNIINPYPCNTLKKFPNLSGNVYANYEWGGFLIWQKPNIKVFVDGRMPAWKDESGKSPYQTYLDIIQTKNGWNEKLIKLKTDYLMIGTSTFLDLLLQKDAKKYGWEEKYRDNIAVIYKSI